MSLIVGEAWRRRGGERIDAAQLHFAHPEAPLPEAGLADFDALPARSHNLQENGMGAAGTGQGAKS